MKLMIKEVLVNPNGGLVPPFDDDGTHVFLAWPTEEEAKKGLAHQVESYDVEAKVMRLLF